MDPVEAATQLEVDVAAPPDAVRRAFRRLVMQHHPDRTGEADTTAVRLLTEAYRVLLQPVERVAAAAGDDTLTVDLPPDETFDRLLDAASGLGDVTYVDPEVGLLEVLVTFDDGRRASAVVSLQGRATGTTDAFVTLEALDDRPPPPASIVIAALLHDLG